MKRIILAAAAAITLAAPAAAMADKPHAIPSAHDAAVHNSNANENAVWGQDRSFYASTGWGEGNMDIKQSFLPENGGVGDQRAEWVATYGPDAP